MDGLPRNVRRRVGAGETPTPPPVAVAPRYDIRLTPLPPRALSPSPQPQPSPSRRPPPPPSPAPHPAPPAALAPAAAWSVAMLLGVAAAVVLVVTRALSGTPPVAVAAWGSVFSSAGHAAALPAPRSLDPAALVAARRAPEPAPEVEHEGYASIPGGVLFTPDSFHPAGSAYDLLLHFHGNIKVVRESAEVAGLNAAVAVVNLGVGSGPYEVAYASPGAYEALLEEINRAAAQRGVPEPRIRRVALSSWSAGYGAIGKVLDVRRGVDPLDAILVLDGIHTGWVEGARSRDLSALNPLPLEPFARAARAAAAGDLLFSITHADIDPIAYAGTGLTADYLLREASGRPPARLPARAAPGHLALRSAEGAVSKKLEKRLEPTTEARVGALRVRGFKGNTPEHHMAHLFQMGATVLPELAARWKQGPGLTKATEAPPAEPSEPR